MSEVAPVTDESAVVDGVAGQPTIHDQAYWDQDLNQLIESWSQLKTTAMQERTDVEKAEWDAFMWQNFLHLREMVMQFALEKSVEAKPARKRAKVPKAALPILESDSDAA